MTASSAVLSVLLAAAAWSDWRHRRVPNALLLPFFAAGCVYQLASGRLPWALWGMACGFLLALGPVMLRGMGMGDQKLLMTVGMWAGAEETYGLFVCAAGVAVTVLAVQPRRWNRTVANLYTLAVGWFGHRTVWLPRREGSALALPYAVCLFAAYWVRLWKG